MTDTVIDLSGGTTSATLTDGTILTASPQGDAGTGNYDTFLVLGAQNTESGFNTDGSPLPLDDKQQEHTNALLLSSMQVVTVGGHDYYVFKLDANEPNSATGSLLSLDSLKIYSATDPNITDLSVLQSQPPLYDMDGNGNVTVQLNAGKDAPAGSGQGDLFVYIPTSFFTGATGNYIYLYSAFGTPSGSDGGFEEWGVITRHSQGPAIGIDKVTVDGAVKADGLTILTGEAISWQYTVSNTGNVALSNIVVTDDHNVVITPVLGDATHNVGDINHNDLLDINEHWIFTGSGSAITGDYANVGTVSGTAGAVTVSDTDGSSYFGAAPDIHIEKVTVDGALKGDNLTILTGEAISWEYTVTNGGNVALSGVNVTDDHNNVVVTAVLGADLVHNVGDTNKDNKLDTTESWSFTGTGVAGIGAYSNIGTATGSFTDTAGDPATPTDTDGSGYFGANAAIKIEKVTVDGATSGDGLT
ncbi:hypothetical protein NKH57_30290, partial [Mesorhizobium sp. M1050]|uniref:DUF7507 domain-containing protein n=1 Tax=Mesorhizobium sp. M1050 TaxID=2957051 RepID=UPI0033363346